ncbi:hypothetical protein [Neodiprion abietis nucleopolyhedrovirus]|uniref:Uncharacterized protein n=1 Tax=Neodiprion abietis nucleopolyhedrovirus TaxID=204507 RepID=Q0ZP60_9CBAC|nr:hypothetical protein [Neodiprion abietis nucleopolyhedrovirus]ABC74894.1 unknown [Neodiprion abietis nucleopolyhedrovirus]
MSQLVICPPTSLINVTNTWLTRLSYIRYLTERCHICWAPRSNTFDKLSEIWHVTYVRQSSLTERCYICWARGSNTFDKLRCRVCWARGSNTFDKLRCRICWARGSNTFDKLRCRICWARGSNTFDKLSEIWHVTYVRQSRVIERCHRVLKSRMWRVYGNIAIQVVVRYI